MRRITSFSSFTGAVKSLFFPVGEPLSRRDFLIAAFILLSVNKALAWLGLEFGSVLLGHCLAWIGTDDLLADYHWGNFLGGILFVLLLPLYWLPYGIIFSRRARCIGLSSLFSLCLALLAVSLPVSWFDEPFSFPGYVAEALLLFALAPWADKCSPPDIPISGSGDGAKSVHGDTFVDF